MPGVRKIESPFNFIAPFESFVAIGDPGCDGLGAEIMTTFAKSLSVERPCDFRLILGDIVPVGTEELYRSVSSFAEAVASEPLYMLCGNHDKERYQDAFGLKNYMLASDKSLIVVLDDSRRRFEPDALEFLELCLREHSRDNIVLAFHIPPPNRFSTNSVPQEEWDKAWRIIAPHKAKVKFILAGHVHSFFEDDLDGIRLVVTGGGGSRLDELEGELDKRRTYHHVLKFQFGPDGSLDYRHVSLDGASYSRELSDAATKANLEDSFQNECMAHVKYRLFAADAQEKGLPGLAKLFRAASDAELYHARNHFNALDGMKGALENLKDSLSQEIFETDTMYKGYLDHSVKMGLGLSSYAFRDALEAEKVHRKLFGEAIAASGEIPLANYFTCSSCGHSFKSEKHPGRCPVCGAPADKIHEVL